MVHGDSAPRLCVTGTEATVEALEARLETSAPGDLQEVRLDHVVDGIDGAFDLVRRHSPSIVATCRRVAEGGAFGGSESDRLALLVRAWEAGAAHVDVELDVLEGAAAAGIPADRTLASIHAPDLDALRSAVDRLALAPAGMVKLAVPVGGAADLVALREIRARLGRRVAVVVGMGDAGLWTRIRPGDVGSAWTFVAAAEGLATAPGQVTRGQAIALRVLESRELRPLAVAGGAQVVHSLGTWVYNRLFAARGLDLQYLPLPAATFDEIRVAIEALGIRGLSVTMPFKRAACAFAEDRDEAAAVLGAANTLWRGPEGAWRAANTDAVAARWLLAGLGLRPGHGVRVLGAGATAVTLAEAADGLGGRVSLAARDVERCRRDLAGLPAGLVARAASWEILPWARRFEGDIDVLGNATPVGADGRSSPWDDDVRLPPRVLDVVRPWAGETPLVRRARESGARVADGLAFWCRQGAAQAGLLAGIDVSPRELLDGARQLRRADGVLAEATGPARPALESGPPAPAKDPGSLLRGAGPRPTRLCVPGSKSATQRVLVLAALARSPSRIANASPSDDSRDLAAVLGAIGSRVEGPADHLRVRPGPVRSPSVPVRCGEGATTARFAACLALRMDGALSLDLGERLRERPLGALARALEAAGAEVSFDPAVGRLVVLRAGPTPEEVEVDLSGSSQPATGLLLVAPGMPSGLRVRPAGRVASRSYLDLTLSWLRRFGVDAVERDGAFVAPPCVYDGRVVEVGGDWSLGGMWMAAQRVTGRRVDLVGLDPADGQGDAVVPALMDALDGPGDCVLDLSSVPDLLPPLAVAALFARRPVRLAGVSHARQKESDRPSVLARELRRLGAMVSEASDGLLVEPSVLRGPAVLDPAGDHRMAMAFGILSLVVSGIEVRDPGCVAKSYPAFWEDLEAFRCAR